MTDNYLCLMLLGVDNFLFGGMEDYLLSFLGICPASKPAT